MKSFRQNLDSLLCKKYHFNAILSILMFLFKEKKEVLQISACVAKFLG